MAKKTVQLVVKSAVKQAAVGMNVAHDVPEALNTRVTQLVEDAAARAKANGRRTLQARDF